MTTALHTPTRQAPSRHADHGVRTETRITIEPRPESRPAPAPSTLSRIGRAAATTVRGIGIFGSTAAKVVILGKHGID
ncbi:hypothetical protein [Yinghuangia soli]|uniref:Uncharacterized protein n=1 Tax=Yinghuangia soli TaxID=2908204 RepID=A0AA41Q2W1_9ACTN|nr:hypothetical protein [Yinghuangia soli]MCF2529419.1 hypothetical protein [Yinghuangia soli]